MDEEMDSLLIGVRADTGGFARDVAAMRASLTEGLGGGADKAGRSIATALAKAAGTGKLGFDDLKSTALKALDEIASAALKGGIASLFGGSGGGGGLTGIASSLLGAAFGLPGRATGGPVSPSAAYVVGERGPELFVPTTSGRIAPAGQAGGGIGAADPGRPPGGQVAPAPGAQRDTRTVRDVRVAISINAPAGDTPATLARSSRQVARAVARALDQAGG